MNVKKIRHFQIFSIIFTFILGTLLHFTYNFFNQNPFVAIFSSINESVWEHLKLIYFPMLITAVLGIIYFKNKIPNFLCSKTIGILTSMIFTVVFFYTYTGILGKNIALIDISLFFIAVMLRELISYIFIVNNIKCNKKITTIILLIIAICFIIFNKKKKKIGLFKDPLINI